MGIGHHSEQSKADSARTDCLIRFGFRVLSFWNHEVLMETEAVQTKILLALQSDDVSHPHLASP